MTKFSNADEKTHPAGKHKYWNESFYMNFFDMGGEWGGASRIGFSPNQKFAEGFVMIFMPGGATGFIRSWEGCSDHLHCSGAGAVRHQCVEPFKKWRLSYQGPIYYFDDPASMGDFARSVLLDLPSKQIELEVEFEALHEVFDFHDSMQRELISGRELLAKLAPGYFFNHLGPALRKVALLKVMSGASHYEHAGRIKTRIAVNGEDHEFEGFGQRDHSWGVRDMRVPSNWRWFSGQFKDELCFNAIKVEVLGFRASGGYVYHEGKAEALKHWSLDSRLDDTGRRALSVSLHLVSVSGKRFDIEGEAMANIPVTVNTEGYVSVVNEARARFAWRGLAGHGISEFMGQMY